MPKRLSFKKKMNIASFVFRVLATIVLGIFIFARIFRKESLSQADLWLVFIFAFLVLADSFTSVSVGNFFSLKKDVKESRKTSEKVFDAITNIAVNNNSNKTTVINNLQNFPPSEKELKERNAEKDSELKAETEIIEVLEKSGKKDDSQGKSDVIKKLSKISFQDIENKCFERYCKENALEISEIDRERKIQFSGYSPFYCDGYYRRGNTDVFIEIKSLEAAAKRPNSVLNYVNPIEQFNRQSQNKAMLHYLVYTFRDDEESQKKISKLSGKYRDGRFADIVELKIIYLSEKDI